jgi:putative transposase
MGPLVRRSWAPRGRPPVLTQKGAHRQKVSVAAALWLPPARDRVGLFTRTLADGYFDNERMVPFLEGLLRAAGGPVVVVWDGGSPHKGGPIRDLLAERAGELWLERLPAYGSELMPVEQLWTWLKYDRLPNFAPHTVGELAAASRRELARAGRSQALLDSFFHGSRLPRPQPLARALLI